MCNVTLFHKQYSITKFYIGFTILLDIVIHLEMTKYTGGLYRLYANNTLYKGTSESQIMFFEGVSLIQSPKV
jgi:hypothetical protein